MILYLVGFMGSGKTTVGQHLHRVMDVAYTDTDARVVQICGCSISEIFAQKGEQSFRRYETQAVKQVLSGIVSTGGGIVETPDNVIHMKSNGTIIYLRTALSTIENRLAEDDSRPLWKQTQASRKKLFEKRCALYEGSADIIVDTDGKSAEKISTEILSLLKE